jgi:hypothetical protein
MGEWKYSSTILDLDIRWMEMSTSPPSALTPGAKPPVRIGYEARWAPESVYTSGIQPFLFAYLQI